MEETKVVVEFEVDKYSSKGLMELLRAMAYCGHAGTSRTLHYFCDGDGSSPAIKKVTIDGNECPCNSLPGSDNWRDVISV